MIISVFDRVENIVGKGEIACTSNFSFSHNFFKRLLFQRRQKVLLCANGLRNYGVVINNNNCDLYLLVRQNHSWLGQDSYKLYHKDVSRLPCILQDVFCHRTLKENHKLVYLCADRLTAIDQRMTCIH